MNKSSGSINCRLLALATTLLCGVPTQATDLHVSPKGKDSNPGTSSAPFQTLGAARDAARGLVGKEPVTIHVADGVYYLPETLVLGAPDSGTAQRPVVYRAGREGGAILSGGLKLELSWAPWKDGIFKAATPAGLAIDQLFVDGRRQHMARYPNFDAARPTAAYQGFAADAFSKERAARWADPAGGYIHAMHVARWGGYHYRITGKNPDGTVAYEGGWQNNRQMGMHKQFRMVENIFEELDAPGEWFHDRKTGTLYYKPEAGLDLGKAVVEVVRLSHLVEFRGTETTPVRFVTLRGFTFRHAARTFMENREPLLRSDWTIYRGGAVLLTGTEDVRILDSEFDQPGGNAIFVNHYHRRLRIQGVHIHDAGASGICFVGDPKAVRDPLFEYGQSRDLAKIDRTPGPKTDNYPADCVVEDCLIHGIGRVERQPAGLQISMASRIVVRDTSIYDCARAGINIGDGCWGGHLIERCDVFDTVLETEDHGSFNSWGRDRYWTSNHRGISEPAVKQDPALPYLDARQAVVIRHSRWRCDHGWDIDLDDGSSNYEIYDNLMLRGGLKFREGYGRRAWNNILVNSGFHPHVWFDHSSSEFRTNIVMAPHAPIGQPQGWGELVDRNLFASEDDLRKNRNSGGDSNSLSGDPMFVNPAAGDFRVRDGSPALGLGFRNFAMDQFGVKKPSLKAMAHTPVIPELRLHPKGSRGSESARRLFWLGAPLHSLQGEEYSAFGVSKDDMGVQLVDVAEGTPAARAGFRPNDLVQGLNGRKVSHTDQFFAALIGAGPSPIKVRLIRNQQPMELTLPAVPYLVTETASDAKAFRRLVPKPLGSAMVTANQPVNNDPLTILGDGQLAQGYGPVFGNGVRNGAYKADLGKAQRIFAVTSWSYNQNGNRGRQAVTIYGSKAADDPGWNTEDATKFVPLGSLDTASLPPATFTAASLRAPNGQNLGEFRWILWETAPVNDFPENTAWQEFSVAVAP